jgi:hypothetical protein
VTTVPDLCQPCDTIRNLLWKEHYEPTISAASNVAVMDADLAPERTEGFKVGEKKTIDEYAKLGLLLTTLHLCTAF